MDERRTSDSRSSRSLGRSDLDSVLVRTRASPDAVGPLRSASTEGHRGRTLALLSQANRTAFVDDWRAGGRSPDRVRTVGFDPTASATGTESDPGGDHDHGTYPDLTGLSSVLVEESVWLAAGDGPGTVYVDALSPFVSAVGLEPTFRFLVLLTGRAQTGEHGLVVRVDPDTLETRALSILATVFDRTFDCSPERMSA